MRLLFLKLFFLAVVLLAQKTQNAFKPQHWALSCVFSLVFVVMSTESKPTCSGRGEERRDGVCWRCLISESEGPVPGSLGMI